MNYGHHAFATRVVCGRCGVYRHLHPIGRCDRPRVSWWWDRHSAARHVATAVWVHVLSSRTRWWIANRIASPQRDWCELVDSVTRADNWANDWGPDYRGDQGCYCDFPLPLDAGPVRPGVCYCTPAGGVDNLTHPVIRS